MYNKQTLFRMVLFLPMCAFLFQHTAPTESLTDILMFLLALDGWRDIVFTIQEIVMPDKENT